MGLSCARGMSPPRSLTHAPRPPSATPYCSLPTAFVTDDVTDEVSAATCLRSGMLAAMPVAISHVEPPPPPAPPAGASPESLAISSMKVSPLSIVVLLSTILTPGLAAFISPT